MSLLKVHIYTVNQLSSKLPGYLPLSTNVELQGQAATLGLYMGAVEANSDFHACTDVFLSSEPFP